MILYSCSSNSHISLSSIYEVNESDYSEYILYNSSTLLPLITVSKYEKIACKDNIVVYIQCSNKQHLSKFNKKQISLNDILVEPGIGFYVKLSDDWYGFVSDINTDISNSDMEIIYAFKKLEYNFIGDIKQLMSYKDYITWIKKSIIVDEELEKAFITVQ